MSQYYTIVCHLDKQYPNTSLYAERHDMPRDIGSVIEDQGLHTIFIRKTEIDALTRVSVTCAEVVSGHCKDAIDVVSKCFNITYGELLGLSRKDNIAIARHTLVYLLRLVGFRLSDTTRITSRHHASSVNSVKKIRNIIETKDAKWFGKVKSCIEMWELVRPSYQRGRKLRHVF